MKAKASIPGEPHRAPDRQERRVLKHPSVPLQTEQPQDKHDSRVDYSCIRSREMVDHVGPPGGELAVLVGG
jgi:hypothetical protein